MLEADSFAEIIRDFDENKLPKKLFNEGGVSYQLPEKIMGQYKLYDFSTAVGASGVKATYHDLKYLLVDDALMDTVLSVTLNDEADVVPSVFGIFTEFQYTENLEFMSWIGVNLRIDGTGMSERGKIPVKLVLASSDERFEAEAEVTAGQWTEVYFNIDDFKNAKDTEVLKILVDCEECDVWELRVKEIVGLSEEYNNESLESVVLEERLKKRSPDGKDYSPYMWLGGGLIIAVATGVAVALLSRKKRVEK